MLLLILGLFFGDSSPHVHRLLLPRPQERPLFDSPATAWITPIKESAEERQMLWNAEHVLYYSGRVTGEPPESFIMILGGYRIPRSRPTIGWHYIDPPHSIPRSDGLRLAGAIIDQRDGPTVIVVDRRDFQDSEGEKAVTNKVAELKGNGLKKVTVLQRGTQGAYCQFPFLMSDTIILYWIADAELTVLFTNNPTPSMTDSNAFTLNPRAGIVGFDGQRLRAAQGIEYGEDSPF